MTGSFLNTLLQQSSRKKISKNYLRVTEAALFRCPRATINCSHILVFQVNRNFKLQKYVNEECACKKSNSMLH